MGRERWTFAAVRRATFALLAGGTVSVVAALAGPATAAAIPVPSADPFYTSPVALSSVGPGAVLRSRKVTIGGLPAVGSTTAYQLLYRTTNATGQPIATVTTLLLPSRPAPGERRLLSYHTAEDSLTTNCAPSYTMQTGTGTTQHEENATILMGLERGWAVVVPDYEGPDSQWTVGVLAGQAALDSVRAVEQFAPAGLAGADTPVTMIGYSGGSIPTVWANALQRSYAPELNLVAIAAGGIPANIADLIEPLSGTLFAGTIMGALIGIDRAYPELRLNSLLNERGRELASRDGTDAQGCSSSVVNAPFVDFAGLTTSSSIKAFLALSQVRNTLAKVDLRRRPTPHAPAYLYNAIHDQLVHIEPVDDLVRVNCAAGATIDYYRDPLPEHLTGLVAFFVRAYPYLEGRFLSGTPAPNSCPAGATPAPPSAGTSPAQMTGSSRLVASRGRVAVKVQCPKHARRCAGTVTLKTTALKILGSARFAVAGGHVKAVTVRLRRHPAGRRATSIRVVVTTERAGRRARTRTRPATLVIARR
jgi:hypothetical protein